MHCYDCLELGRTTVASGGCVVCGAALCREHTTEETKQIQQIQGMGQQVHPTRARRLLCGRCSKAEHDRSLT
ncbi:DUF2180 family protein [Streptomyces sp. Qhu-G9]|uniref:DUF2180 family protein n=1 Tax=Streptomyces sp. Qhu-G9 TaxID=3452799 RepID=UPI0022AC0999|nr:DUF2180 family protein [Streptomyces aurantiacus]WAU81424.1 DUF2180 family protein [Streptomyces aurantiacus]